MLLVMKQPEEDLSTSDQLDQDQDGIVYNVTSPKKQRTTGLLFTMLLILGYVNIPCFRINC